MNEIKRPNESAIEKSSSMLASLSLGLMNSVHQHAKECEDCKSDGMIAATFHVIEEGMARYAVAKITNDRKMASDALGVIAAAIVLNGAIAIENPHLAAKQRDEN